MGLLEDDGDEIKSFIKTTPGVIGKEVTLTLKNEINSGDFTLVVEKIDDIYGNTMDKVEYAFSAEDDSQQLLNYILMMIFKL